MHLHTVIFRNGDAGVDEHGEFLNFPSVQKNDHGDLDDAVADDVQAGGFESKKMRLRSSLKSIKMFLY